MISGDRMQAGSVTSTAVARGVRPAWQVTDRRAHEQCSIWAKRKACREQSQGPYGDRFWCRCGQALSFSEVSRASRAEATSSMMTMMWRRLARRVP